MDMFLTIILSISLGLVILNLIHFLWLQNNDGKGFRFIPFILLAFLAEFSFILMFPGIKEIMALPWLFYNPLAEILAYSFLFLFFMELISKQRLSRKKVFLYMIPTIIITISSVAHYIAILMKSSINDQLFIYRLYFDIALSLFFAVISFRKLKDSKLSYSSTRPAYLIWALIILFAGGPIYFGYIAFDIHLLGGSIWEESSGFLHFQNLAILIVFYIYLFKLYDKEQRQKGARLQITQFNLPIFVTTKTEVPERVKPVAEKFSDQDKGEDKEIQEAIEYFFTHSKELYLMPGFNLNMLAEFIEYPAGKISAVLRNRFDTSFSKYLNEQRIAYAIELLEDPHNVYSATELTKLCGYRSRTSFYNNFREITGLLPSEYKETQVKTEQ